MLSSLKLKVKVGYRAIDSSSGVLKSGKMLWYLMGIEGCNWITCFLKPKWLLKHCMCLCCCKIEGMRLAGQSDDSAVAMKLSQQLNEYSKASGMQHIDFLTTFMAVSINVTHKSSQS